LTVLREFEPQNVVGHRVANCVLSVLNKENDDDDDGPQKGTSLGHNACFEPYRVKFHARVTSVGESGKK